MVVSNTGRHPQVIGILVHCVDGPGCRLGRRVTHTPDTALPPPMTVGLRPAGLLAGILAGLTLAACAARPSHHVPLRVRPRTAALLAGIEDLLTRIETLAAEGHAFAAVARLRLDDHANGRSREVGVRIAARKPDQLRIQGVKALLPTLFVLVANPDGVWLDVPSHHRTYLLPAGRPPHADAATGLARTLLALSPGELLSALVPDPPAAGERWVLAEEPQAYELLGLRSTPEAERPTRRLRFERQHLGLVELRLYDREGRLTTIAILEPDRDGGALPRAARIERPREELTLHFEFRDRRPPPAGDAVFSWTPLPGREPIDLSRSAGPEAVPNLLPGAMEEAP